jgi:modulator of FtsH protease
MVMSDFNVDTWHDFFVAQAGAGAALAGLVFVAISINLQRVLAVDAVQGRAVEALTLLLSLLIVGLLALIPEQGETALGVEMLLFGLTLAAVLIRVGFGVDKAGGATRGQHLLRLALGQLASLPLVGGGIFMVADADGALYWLACAAIFAIVAGMIGAWVLLVEILR